MKKLRRVNWPLSKRSQRQEFIVRRDLPSTNGPHYKFTAEKTLPNGIKVIVSGPDLRRLKKKQVKQLQKNPYGKIIGTSKELYGRGKGPKARGKEKKKRKQRKKDHLW